MSIKSITIENFKGIREPVKFDLAPIVLMYGPNSAGKSTFLQALAYLNDVIVHDQCNGEFTHVGGDSMHLGGFSNTVNGHDVSKNIRFVFEFDDLADWSEICFAHEPSEGYEENYRQCVRDNKKAEVPFLTSKLIKDGLFVEFHISWSLQKKKAFISCCKFIAQDVEVIDIRVEDTDKKSTIQFNFEHPCFRMENSRYVKNPNPEKYSHWNTVFDCITRENSLLMSPISQKLKFKEKGIFEHPTTDYGSFPGGNEYWKYPRHMQGFMSARQQRQNELEEIIKSYPLLGELFLFGLDNVADEKKEKERSTFLSTTEGQEALKRKSEIEEKLKMPIEHERINDLFDTYFSSIIAKSFETIYDFVDGLVYIGPLRKKPNAVTIMENRTSSSWHDGMSAWQLLNGGISDDQKELAHQRLAEVNNYLGGVNYFNSGYRIQTQKKLSMEMELTGELQKLLEHHGEIDLAALKQQIHHNSQFKETLKLHDVNRGVDVDLTAVGTGISQIVPIITAMIFDDVNVVMVEQPELHIHPRMQVQFGELMVDSLASKQKNNDKQKLHFIETHSQALLLRLMRRVREPSNMGNLLKPEDLAVYYVDMVDGATQIVKRINLDADGDFIDEWPDGFFVESFNENFGGR